MSMHILETASSQAQQGHPVPSRRRHSLEDTLVLTELNPLAVVDHLDHDNDPLRLTTFGSVRETCPKCEHAHLRLILRQDNVRTAHLFCAECASCFDAHYPNGTSALTI